jgi:hypothetical protein
MTTPRPIEHLFMLQQSSSAAIVFIEVTLFPIRGQLLCTFALKVEMVTIRPRRAIAPGSIAKSGRKAYKKLKPGHLCSIV